MYFYAQVGLVDKEGAELREVEGGASREVKMNKSTRVKRASQNSITPDWHNLTSDNSSDIIHVYEK